MVGHRPNTPTPSFRVEQQDTPWDEPPKTGVNRTKTESMPRGISPLESLLGD